LAFETPLLAWVSRCATVLPGEQVVYEVEGQVVLLDLGTRRMQFLARGSSPVVVIRRDEGLGVRAQTGANADGYGRQKAAVDALAEVCRPYPGQALAAGLRAAGLCLRRLP
jgi:hypothetical protein